MRTRRNTLSILVLFTLLVGCGEQSPTYAPTRSTASTEDTVITIVSKQLDVPAAKVTPDSRLITELGANEIDIAEMIMSVQEAFRIEIPDKAIEKKLGGKYPDLQTDLTVRQLAELAERK